MQSLSAANIVRIWEVAHNQHAIDRALTMLAFGCPEKSAPELVALSVGQRDAHLLTLRELTFGSTVAGCSDCPSCQERLEFDLSIPAIRTLDPNNVIPQEHSFTWEEFELQFRLPNSLDLAAIVQCQDAAKAHGLLVQRCLLKATRRDEIVSPSELAAEVLTAVAERMGECDPQAEIRLALSCPACDHSWSALFDIVDFFWAELNAQAMRLLQEVHTLAKVYGWGEADILLMSALRRQFYLNLVS